MATGEILRETDWFTARIARNGVRISAKDPNVRPKSKIVSSQTWEILEGMSDSEFNGTVVMEIGVGTFAK